MISLNLGLENGVRFRRMDLLYSIYADILHEALCLDNRSHAVLLNYEIGAVITGRKGHFGLVSKRLKQQAEVQFKLPAVHLIDVIYT
ncbi:hypothetical protein SAMN05443246_3979 [Paenibacillus sp. GP183]|nr:hypothetical protein SAMN05443246_3979 [Paenibacillus sp. GP183]